ncbi:MAG: tRNA (adenosine(37)-N6)-threonylcarbamoyltransferase complex dimerization subunit type 1 TsaB [Methylobacteriaceae bacterium]|nr:tRNA (adenosine(37)-N6)-threonylcarbamoyltransferase complex dimerization subunit type 1 TsaB [Methylobacteriaceae bacterium]
MQILAIDTALGAASACVLMQGQAEPVAGETLLMERGHAEALLPLVDRVMARVEGGFDVLSRIAVTIGPGSFTGIRVGLSAARAIGLACAVPVVGVSVLASLAAPLFAENETSVAVAVVDARHGNIYFQPFAPGGRALSPPRLSSLRDAVRWIGAGPFRMAGPGARALAAEAQNFGLRADVVGALSAPEIAFVARLGLISDPETALPRPLYLKPPDARPQDDGHIARV